MPTNLKKSNAQQQTQKVEILKQLSEPKQSLDTCNTNQYSNRSAFPRKFNQESKQKALLITVIWSSLLGLATCSLSTSAPTVGYKDPQILTGKVTLNKDQIPPYTENFHSYFMQYNISVNIPTTYSIHIGIYALSVQNSSSSDHTLCNLQKDHDSDTVLRVTAQYDKKFTFYTIGINYIAIEPNYFSTAVEEIIKDSGLPEVELNSLNSESKDFNLSSIQSGHSYRAINFLRFIRLYVIDNSTIGNLLYTINLDIQNSKCKHITQGDNIKLMYDKVYVLVFKLDTTQRTRLQIYTVQTNSPGDRLMSIDTDVQINVNNTIIGLMSFTISNTNLHFNFYHNNGEIWLQNSIDTPTTSADIALIYAMECASDSYFYSETDGLCHPCLDSCLRCSNLSVCEMCAVNFTLQNSSTECNCPFSTVSGLCYEFQNSPMMGCQSAEVNSSSNQIICLQCSEMAKLILNNNECVCRSGYQRADNSVNCSEVLDTQTKYSDSNFPGVVIGVALGLIVVLTGTGLLYYRYCNRRNQITSMRQHPIDSQSVIFGSDFK